MYENIVAHLRSHVERRDLSLSLRKAARAGPTKLKQYYEMARGGQFNIISMSKPPRQRLISLADVLQPFIRRLVCPSSAKILFNHPYMSYKKISDNEKVRARSAQEQHSGRTSCLLPNIFAFNDNDMGEAASELDLFLAAFRTYGRGSLHAPLLWWKVLLSSFPFVLIAHFFILRLIPRMVTDFLAIPGTSVSV
ncbi:hypothetical protein C8R45DRAFT_928795 [Mycena sanguinolenta]|nr:hypothetical protein C8R45DRAFT_928795 [Mycena sanguinolenta]